MNRAVLIGINRYAMGCNLRGCVNDAMNMRQFLVDRCEFASQNVSVLSDESATEVAAKIAIETLVESLYPDDYGVVHISGHGTIVPTLDAAAEPDGFDEAICCHDLCWEPMGGLIRDKWLSDVCATVVDGARLLLILDTCFSGGLFRTEPVLAWPRYVTPPKRVLESGLSFPRGIRSAVGKNAAMISACRTDQTSADTMFDGRYEGAFTHFLLKQLSSKRGLKQRLSLVACRTSMRLRRADFGQRPECDGNPNILDGPFPSQRSDP